ncbi:unnamed protein product, partial [Discosporangium mesarthrocarpum]
MVTSSSAQERFKAISVARWGSLCIRRESPTVDWKFYLRRIGHRAPATSSLNLIQECFSEDAYHLLGCCILCSRTSGGQVIRETIARFFKEYPTPTAVIEADQGALRQLLLPLGLNREVTIKRFADGFLSLSWTDPRELHGCGRFASDSWRIFCLGRPPKNWNRDPSMDRTLVAYLRCVDWSGNGPALVVAGKGKGGAEGGQHPAKRRRKALLSSAPAGELPSCRKVA